MRRDGAIIRRPCLPHPVHRVSFRSCLGPRHQNGHTKGVIQVASNQVNTANRPPTWR